MRYLYPHIGWLLILLLAGCNDSGSASHDEVEYEDVELERDLGSWCSKDALPQITCQEIEPNLLSHEQYQEGQLPEELGETPRVVWWRTVFCEGEIGAGGVVDWNSDHYAYGQMKIGDEEREAVVLTVDYDADFGPALKGVSAICPQTGEELACNNHGYVGRVATFNISPELDRYYFSTHEDLGNQLLIGAFEEGFQETYYHLATGGMYASHRFGDDGRLWLYTGPCLPYSFHPKTGEYLGPVDMGDKTRDEIGFFPSWLGLDNKIYWNSSVAGPFYFRATGCGVGEEVSRNEARSTSSWKGLRVIVEKNGVLELIDSQTLETLYLIEDCYSWIALEDGRILCVGSSNNENQRTLLTLYDRDGLVSSRKWSGEEDWSGKGHIPVMLLAGAEGRIIMVRVGKKEEIRVHFWTLDQLFDQDQQPSTFAIEGFRMYGDGYVKGGAPFITPSGMLVIGIWGNYFGIQTDIPGMAKTPYPSSVSQQSAYFHPFGGAERRGPVDVGEGERDSEAP